jgi:hypothetical protein
MTPQLTNSKTTSEAINRVIKNNQPFSKIYFEFAKDWVSKRFKSFTSDDIRKAFLDSGGLPPRHHNAWGGCLSQLSNKGLIFDTEKKVKSNRSEAHNRELRIWISIEFKAKQQSNGKKEASLDMFK